MKCLPGPDYFEIQYLFTGGVCGFAAKVFFAWLYFVPAYVGTKYNHEKYYFSGQRPAK